MNKLDKQYTISLSELVQRPDIRDDYTDFDVWMNKLTDEEYEQFDKESRQMCIEEGIKNEYPDINAAVLSKHIDRGILYKLLTTTKQEANEQTR